MPHNPLIAQKRPFSGRAIQAEEAKELGIVMEVVEEAALRDRALELARSFAANPPQALRLTKRLMKAAKRMEIVDFLDYCAIFQGMCHNTEDHLEAVASMIEKRTPQFCGR
ncbi:enoyl-CoA hydratase-related protein [Cupriavidus sp. PET2-C1]